VRAGGVHGPGRIGELLFAHRYDKGKFARRLMTIMTLCGSNDWAMKGASGYDVRPIKGGLFEAGAEPAFSESVTVTVQGDITHPFHIC
jgi:hypothetical protein